MSRRVVITGMGAVTPIGNNVEDFWANVKKGTVGIGPITKFDSTAYKAHLAAELKDFDVTEYGIDKKAARRMEDFSKYAVVAAKEALGQSGLDHRDITVCRDIVYGSIDNGQIRTCSFYTIAEFGCAHGGGTHSCVTCEDDFLNFACVFDGCRGSSSLSFGLSFHRSGLCLCIF